MLHLVIMAGGSGTRFWPESRCAKPKQFLRLAGDRTLIQQAADRCQPWVPFANVRVVTNAAHAGETASQLPALDRRNILLEPCGRNTAPCIGLAARQILEVDPDAVLLITPADHLIRPEAEFRATVERSLRLIEKQPGASILFGIEPTYPATGYGYIEKGAAVTGAEGGAARVKAFHEKPTLERARQFLATGNFYWNSGIFVWRADRVIDLLQEYQPEIHAGLERIATRAQSAGWQTAIAEQFPKMPSISIDFGVLEPLAARTSAAESVYVLPATFQWDDVGSWQALPGVLGTDDYGNTTAGPVCLVETEGCVVRSTCDHLVATIGLKDFVVVHTPDATLIAPQGDEAAIRKLVALLKERGHERFL